MTSSSPASRQELAWIGLGPLNPARIGMTALVVIVALLAVGDLFGFVGVQIVLPLSALLAVALRRGHDPKPDRLLESPLYRG